MQIVQFTKTTSSHLCYVVIHDGTQKNGSVIQLRNGDYALCVGSTVKQLLKGTPVDVTMYPRIGNGDKYAKDVMLNERTDAGTFCGYGLTSSDMAFVIRMDSTSYLKANPLIEGLSEDRSFNYFIKQAHETFTAHSNFIIEANNDKTNGDNDEPLYVIDKCLVQKTVDISGQDYYALSDNPTDYGDNANDTTRTRQLYHVTRTVVFLNEHNQEITSLTDTRIANHPNVLNLKEGSHYTTVLKIDALRQDSSIETVARGIADDLGITFLRVDYDEELSSVYITPEGELLNVVPLTQAKRWSWDNTLAVSSSFDTEDVVMNMTPVSTAVLISGRSVNTHIIPSDKHVNGTDGTFTDVTMMNVTGMNDSHYRVDGTITLGARRPTFTSLNKETYVPFTYDGTNFIHVQLFDKPKNITTTTAEDSNGSIDMVNKVIGLSSDGEYIANDARYWHVTGNVTFELDDAENEEDTDKQYLGGTQREWSTKINQQINLSGFDGGVFRSIGDGLGCLDLYGIVPDMFDGRIHEKNTGYHDFIVQFYYTSEKPDITEQKVGGTIRKYSQYANRYFSGEVNDLHGSLSRTNRDVFPSKPLSHSSFTLSGLGNRLMLYSSDMTQYIPTLPSKENEIRDVQMLCGTLRKYGSDAVQGIPPDGLMCYTGMTTLGFTNNRTNSDLTQGMGMPIIVQERLKVHNNQVTFFTVTFPLKESSESTLQCIGGTFRTSKNYKNQMVPFTDLISTV